MTLYHGSNCRFSGVDLSKSKDKRDFGRGFYLTTIKKQAKEWASFLFDVNGGEAQFVYEFDLTITDDLKFMKFDAISEEWLDFIVENRSYGGLRHGFDIVQGPVANDRTTRTINLFVDGSISAKAALDQLEYLKPNNQVSVHTLKAVSCLHLVKVDAYAG